MSTKNVSGLVDQPPTTSLPEGQTREQRIARTLAPRSLAIVGASPRASSMGSLVMQLLREGGYPGRVFLVNSRYQTIDGQQCHASLGALPEQVDVAVLAVGAQQIEAIVDEAIDAGIAGAVIYDLCHLASDRSPSLVARLRQKAAQSGLIVVGGAGMGYFNFERRIMLGMTRSLAHEPGGISLIAHSGGVFALLAAANLRYRFNIAISPGQEINGSIADYLEYCLGLPSTRVVALFIEAVRDPSRFVRALRKAWEQGTPVVILKVGRSELAARAAATHTGAMVGSDEAFDAVCQRYNVVRVETLDELLFTSVILERYGTLPAGQLACISDSGGMREILLDTAERVGVGFANLSADSLEELQRALPSGLVAMNPLDAAGPLDDQFVGRFIACTEILCRDPQTAICAVEFALHDNLSGYFSAQLVNECSRLIARSGKPIVLLNSLESAPTHRIAGELRAAGIPLINGVRNLLGAIKRLEEQRQRQRRGAADYRAPMADSEVVSRWRRKLKSAAGALTEWEGLQLLRDFGITVPEHVLVSDALGAVRQARALGYPVALKSSSPGLAHKTEADGVRLGLRSDEDVRRAYADIAERIHPLVQIQCMAEPGVELGFGMVNDPQFGPIITIGAGGVLIELLRERRYVMPPFDDVAAHELIASLRIMDLLRGYRGRAAADIGAVALALSRFSVLVAALADGIEEMDVNPLIAGPAGCVAVDALVVRR